MSLAFPGKPVAIYRSRAELDADSSVPKQLVPADFDFGASILVRLNYQLDDGWTSCRDETLGMSGKQAIAHEKAAAAFRKRAASAAKRWQLQANPAHVTVQGTDIIRRTHTPNQPLPNQGMCQTTFITQPTLAVIPKTTRSIRVVD